MVFKILFKAKAKAVKATTMESIHNRTSIKNHCSNETHVAAIIQTLIREQNGLLF